jgi:hypothetical protein
MAQEAGFTPQAVPPKILFPLLEGASFEEDENLHDMWAALLANAASPGHAEKVRPAFISVLKQMSPDEARVLKWLHEHEDVWKQRNGFSIFDLQSIQVELAFVTKEESRSMTKFDGRFVACLDGLEGELLIRRDYWKSEDQADPKVYPAPVLYTFTITVRGVDFIEACRPPKPTPKSCQHPVPNQIHGSFVSCHQQQVDHGQQFVHV